MCIFRILSDGFLVRRRLRRFICGGFLFGYFLCVRIGSAVGVVVGSFGSRSCTLVLVVFVVRDIGHGLSALFIQIPTCEDEAFPFFGYGQLYYVALLRFDGFYHCIRAVVEYERHLLLVAHEQYYEQYYEQDEQQCKQRYEHPQPEITLRGSAYQQVLAGCVYGQLQGAVHQPRVDLRITAVLVYEEYHAVVLEIFENRRKFYGYGIYSAHADHAAIRRCQIYGQHAAGLHIRFVRLGGMRAYVLHVPRSGYGGFQKSAVIVAHGAAYTGDVRGLFRCPVKYGYRLVTVGCEGACIPVRLQPGYNGGFNRKCIQIFFAFIMG